MPTASGADFHLRDDKTVSSLGNAISSAWHGLDQYETDHQWVTPATLGGIGKGAVSGASTGAAAGPVGAVLGAVVGGAVGGAQANAQYKAQQKAGQNKARAEKDASMDAAMDARVTKPVDSSLAGSPSPYTSSSYDSWHESVWGS